MKPSLVTVLSVCLLGQSAAFVPTASRLVAKPLFAVELTPEPEGGEELTAVKSMDGSRLKNMGEAEGVSSDDGTVFKFWLTATAQGPLVKQLNTQVLKDASKQANFPGFRKVGFIFCLKG